MTFLVTLIALVIERFFDWSHLRKWGWYDAYQNKILQKLSGVSPYLGLAAAIVPWLIIIWLIDAALSDVLYGFVKTIFDVIILLYCFGPQNLWANAFGSINGSPSSNRHFLNDIFIEANRRVFAIVFWFVLLGPVGAVLYRLVALSAASGTVLNQYAVTVENVLDWLPARLFTFFFALGGHFVKVINIWRHKFLLGLNTNEALLTDCGTAAVGGDEKNKTEDSAAGRDAIGLLDRSFVIFLVLVALVTFLI